MPRRTRRIKNYKNRSMKIGGASDTTKSTLGIMGDAVTGALGKAADVGLHMVGLERIKKDQSPNISENHSTPGIITDVKNKADSTGAYVLNDVNDVLTSNSVQGATQQAAQDTADVIKESADKFNNALNDPQVKQAVITAIDNAGQIGEAAVNAAEKPLEKVIDVAAKKAPEVVGSLGSGVIKAGTDLLGAVPFVGAVIDAGKFANDVANSATKAFEAGKDVVDTTVEAVSTTTQSIKDELKTLEQNKQMSQQISDRTSDSIKKFETPNIPNMGQNTIPNMEQPAIRGGGGKKTKKFLKRKSKSKRVRFAA